MPVHSIVVHLYYITFIDDFSIKTWIYYLNHKDEAFEMFKEFKTLIENKIGKIIKVFRSDNGGEYMSNKFIAFCKKEWVKKETIVPYTLEQNGLAERKNMSILEVSHAMLHGQKVPKFLWAEATHAVVYVQNMVPHQALENKTPEEIFIGVKLILAIFVYLDSPYIFKYRRTKGTSWKL